jgi:hypothetical protein
MVKPNHPLQTPQTAITGETLPAGKLTPGLMPAPPATSAGEPENTNWSPAGPGKPVDGSPAVNTYTPREVQAQEFAAGAQDWPNLVEDPAGEVPLPPGSPEPNPDRDPEVPPPESKPESNPRMARFHEPQPEGEGAADKLVRSRRSI